MVPNQSIDHKTLDSWREKGVQFQLVDVRDHHERLARHIGGIHIPLNEITRRSNEIETEIPVVLYCRKGVRSQLAIQRLAMIHPDLELYNLTGGIGP